MGVMKRNLLLFGILAAAFVTMPAFASVTVEQSTEPEYLINSGYSEIAAESIFIGKNRANGKSIEPLYEKSKNRFTKFCRALYGYTDPTIDTYDRVHHNIKLSPSWSDL